MIVIIWINDINNRKRYDHMNTQLDTHFPNNRKIRVEAIMETPKYNGISMAHMISILKGIKTKKCNHLLLTHQGKISAQN